jgi:hypothetical protein
MHGLDIWHLDPLEVIPVSSQYLLGSPQAYDSPILPVGSHKLAHFGFSEERSEPVPLLRSQFQLNEICLALNLPLPGYGRRFRC